MLALPRCCHGGSVDWDGQGAEGASTTGSEDPPPPRRRPQREGGGGGVRGACPPRTWWPLAEGASDPWPGLDATVMRGYSRPPRCG